MKYSEEYARRKLIEIRKLIEMEGERLWKETSRKTESDLRDFASDWFFWCMVICIPSAVFIGWYL